MKLFWAVAYLFVLLRLLLKRRHIIPVLRTSKSFLLLLFLAISSTAWSIAPSVTFSKSAPLVLSALIGLDIALSYRFSEQLRLYSRVLVTVIALGVIAQVFLPGFIPIRDVDPGSAWNGIVSNKNDWARLVVLTGIVILNYSAALRRGLTTQIAIAAVVMALLVASRSATGLLVMTAILLLSCLLPFLRTAPKALLLIVPAGALIATAAAFWIFHNVSEILTLLGKDPSLTGRVPLWMTSLAYVTKRPLLGHGYAAFWSAHSQPAMLIREELHWPSLPHAHNGYIDLTLALGVAGLLTYFAAYLSGFVRSLSYFRRHSASGSAWPIAYLVFIALYQLTESSIVAGNQLLWILYSSLLFSLSLAAAADHRGLPIAEQDGVLADIAVPV